MLNLVIETAALYGSELWDLLLQHDWKKYYKYPNNVGGVQEFHNILQIINVQIWNAER